VLIACEACAKGAGFLAVDGGGNDVEAGTDTGRVVFGSSDASDGGSTGGPTTCAEAVAEHSYTGCDFWPTVTVNPVWSVFDFAAVVANTQTVTATVTVTGPGGVDDSVTVKPSSLTPVYLPWVSALKGGDFDPCTTYTTLNTSVSATASAYHLTSTVPVSVYQFNALEYQGKGGAPQKDWSSCPGATMECTPDGGTAFKQGCFSFSNDASLLLPTSALTGNYRVTGEHGSTGSGIGGFFAITATTNDTEVTVTLSSTASVLAGGAVSAAGPGGQLTLSMNAGDVVQVMGDDVDNVDLSGSLVQANEPVQVLVGTQCSEQPYPALACDHLESSVLPAETLGTDYVVTVPTSPHAMLVGHVVRFYGNVDGTTLTYSPSQPAGCPSTLNAGDVVECTGATVCTTGLNYLQNPIPVSCVNQSFEVQGTHEFAVSSFMLAGSAVDPVAAEPEGDPSMSPMVATEQYLTRYIFLAPNDYDENYADIVAPPEATIKLDGVPVNAPAVTLNSSWSIIRTPLGEGQGGAHVLTGTKPFGVQVIGYGAYTSYQYPAGLNLVHIAAPPIK